MADTAFIVGTGSMSYRGGFPLLITTMPTLNFEYPLGSKNRISVPPSLFQQIATGYRFELAGGYYIDIPDGLDVFTDRGFLAPFELQEKYPDKSKFLLLEEGTFVHSVDPLEEYIGPTSISIMQKRQFKILSITPIVDKLIQLNIPHGTLDTRATPTYVFLLALLKDPHGIKYVLPVVSS